MRAACATLVFRTRALTTVTGVLNIVCGVVFLIMPAFSGVVFGYVIAAYLIVAGASLVVEGISMRPIER